MADHLDLRANLLDGTYARHSSYILKILGEHLLGNILIHKRVSWGLSNRHCPVGNQRRRSDPVLHSQTMVSSIPPLHIKSVVSGDMLMYGVWAGNVQNEVGTSCTTRHRGQV